jgi:hypothetical protein
LSPGNRSDLDVRIPEQAGGNTFTVEDRFTRRAFQLASIKVIQLEAVKPPDITPPTATDFIPAQMFENVKVGKTWDLNAIRGGKYGIGWTMNLKLWPDDYNQSEEVKHYCDNFLIEHDECCLRYF